MTDMPALSFVICLYLSLLTHDCHCLRSRRGLRSLTACSEEMVELVGGCSCLCQPVLCFKVFGGSYTVVPISSLHVGVITYLF